MCMCCLPAGCWQELANANERAARGEQAAQAAISKADKLGTLLRTTQAELDSTKVCL